MRAVRSLRAGVVVASLSVVLAACGGGPSGAPDSASVEDFCDAYNSLFSEMLADVDAEASQDEQAKQVVAGLKKWSEKLIEVGTPEEMPDDAREGFVVSMESIADLDEDASQKDLEDLEDNFSNDDKASGDKFDAYASETCADSAGGDILPDLPDQE